MDEGEDKEPVLYELAFLLDPTVAEELLLVEFAKIREELEGAGATITVSDNGHMRYLAYNIEKRMGGKRKKYNQAYFGWVKFNAKPETVSKMARMISEIPSVLRLLLTHAASGSTTPTPRRWTVKPMEAKVTEIKPTEAEIDAQVESLIASTAVPVTTNA